MVTPAATALAAAPAAVVLAAAVPAAVVPAAVVPAAAVPAAVVPAAAAPSHLAQDVLLTTLQALTRSVQAIDSRLQSLENGQSAPPTACSQHLASGAYSLLGCGCSFIR